MKGKFILCFAAALIIGAGLAVAEVIEEIYAVVNDEVITLNELRKAEAGQARYLQSQLKGEALDKAMAEMKAGLLNSLIDRKLISTVAKEKKYEVDGDVEMILQEIKKQNNIASDDDLKRALAGEGLTIEEFRTQLKRERISQRFIQEEVGSKIKIDNSEIVDFYRKNIARFSVPQEITLNAVFLKKENAAAAELQATREKISAAVTPENFDETAKQYSALYSEENKSRLGKFKKGEIQKDLENAALALQKNQISPWIETAEGWYLIQVVEITEPRMIDLKEVRDEIARTLQEKMMGEEMKKYMDLLRSQSHVRILKEYK